MNPLLVSKPASSLKPGDEILIAYPKTRPRCRYMVEWASLCGAKSVRLYAQRFAGLFGTVSMTLPRTQLVEVAR